MAKINLLPWREERRNQRKNEFKLICIGVVVLGALMVGLTWMFFDNKLNDQFQANQLITSTNQNLDQQLKALEGLQERRQAIVERMNLIQGLQGKRPISVRLLDELVRVSPSQMYITKFSRTGDKFTVEGRAESPNTVAEFLRGLENSQWYRNAFMNSYLAASEEAKTTTTSVVPRIEASYGTFVVTVDLDDVEKLLKADPNVAPVEEDLGVDQAVPNSNGVNVVENAQTLVETTGEAAQ